MTDIDDIKREHSEIIEEIRGFEQENPEKVAAIVHSDEDAVVELERDAKEIVEQIRADFIEVWHRDMQRDWYVTEAKLGYDQSEQHWI